MVARQLSKRENGIANRPRRGSGEVVSRAVPLAAAPIVVIVRGFWHSTLPS